MPPAHHLARRSAGWEGLKRGHRARWHEWLAERVIFLVSLTAILMVFLIFVFVAREGLPIFLGQVNSAAAQEQKVIPAEAIDRLPAPAVQEALGFSRSKFAEATLEENREMLKAIMEVRAEAAAEAAGKAPDKDAEVNTASWRYLLLPHQWSDYDRPAFIWQPVSLIHKYNIVPLLVGSLKTTLVALLFATPLALAAAIYVSQLASPRWKEWIKPAIELLAGIPSVVLGFFALIVMASFLQAVCGYQSRLNAFVAGVALGLASLPVVFSIAEDALTSVPRSYTEAALALGASKWKAAWQVVLPAAVPGVFAAIVLGFGRAIGETMVVLLASGNASILSWSIFDSTRTITATIAAELGEVVFGGHHYRILFMLGTLLFAVTFVSNLLADVVVTRLKQRLEGRR